VLHWTASVQTAQDDIDTERAAYQMSRAGLDIMYQESQQRLQHEVNCRTVSRTVQVNLGYIIVGSRA